MHFTNLTAAEPSRLLPLYKSPVADSHCSNVHGTTELHKALRCARGLVQCEEMPVVPPWDPRIRASTWYAFLPLHRLVLRKPTIVAMPSQLLGVVLPSWVRHRKRKHCMPFPLGSASSDGVSDPSHSLRTERGTDRIAMRTRNKTNDAREMKRV